jgi:glycosyltransferase involved in cell wall biosynthesis
MQSTRNAGSSSLRVALIPAIFDPRLSYLENAIASALHRQGHEVKIFASEFGARYDTFPLALDESLPFQVYRSGRVLRFKGTQIPYDLKVGTLIREFRPDVVFLVAPLHGLGYMWMKHLPATCCVVSAFSDIPWHRRGRALATWIKKHWARKILRRSSMVMAVTPETKDLLESWTDESVHGKIRMTGLLLDVAPPGDSGTLPEEVDELRQRVRSLAVLITRVTPEKKLDGFFDEIETFLLGAPESGFVIAGLGANEASEKLRQRVARSSTRERCVVLPMLCENQVRAVFAAADLSVWNSVSIGLYHSLAGGCPAVLWSGQVSKHLIREGENGMWFARMDEAADTLLKALRYPWDRPAIKASIAGANADQIVAEILAALDVRGHSTSADPLQLSDIV